MLYMVELHYSQDSRDAALNYFWEHGSTHFESKVTIKDSWVATQDLIAYAVVDAAGPDEIASACKPLEQFGEVSHRRVRSVDEI